MHQQSYAVQKEMSFLVGRLSGEHSVVNLTWAFLMAPLKIHFNSELSRKYVGRLLFVSALKRGSEASTKPNLELICFLFLSRSC